MKKKSWAKKELCLLEKNIAQPRHNLKDVAKLLKH